MEKEREIEGGRDRREREKETECLTETEMKKIPKNAAQVVERTNAFFFTEASPLRPNSRVRVVAERQRR